MGALPEKMVDFTNFKIEVVTLARFNDGKIREKWEFKHQMVDEP